MRSFEAILYRNFKEKGWKFFFTFIGFLVGGTWWRAFVALLLLSGLLPKDIGSSEEEILTSLPFKRWELFLYDFIQGAGVLFVAGAFRFDPRSLVILPYVYGISVLSSYYGKGNFILPLALISVDYALSGTWWGYLSPMRGSLGGTVLSLLVFAVAFLVYSSDGKPLEGITW